MSSDCSHEEFQFWPDIRHVLEPIDFRFAELRIRCLGCNEQFHWRGIASGLPNPAEPTVSADGYALYAPIAVGPGAVVGLLERTGLSDRLVDPARLTPI